LAYKYNSTFETPGFSGFFVYPAEGDDEPPPSPEEDFCACLDVEGDKFAPVGPNGRGVLTLPQSLRTCA